MYEKIADTVLENLNNQGIFDRSDYTFTEYVDELMKFQRAAAKIVLGKDVSDYVRMNEVIAGMEKMAREKEMIRNSDIMKGIQALKLINKEISIAMAGRNAEDRVANTFQYVTRQDARFYRNMYVSNDTDETELDAVVLTRNGILILEVKNAKEDITISPDGRIMFNNSSCYHDISIGEKMERKTHLLKERLEKELRSQGLDKDIVVEGLLVFSNPNGVRIRVTDQDKQVNYCFRGGLFERIDSFENIENYTDYELNILGDILQSIETEKKRFDIKINPEEIKQNFAKAIAVLTYAPQESKLSDIEEYTPDNVQKSIDKYGENHSEAYAHNQWMKNFAGVACAGVLRCCSDC